MSNELPNRPDSISDEAKAAIFKAVESTFGQKIDNPEIVSVESPEFLRDILLAEVRFSNDARVTCRGWSFVALEPEVKVWPLFEPHHVFNAVMALRDKGLNKLVLNRDTVISYCRTMQGVFDYLRMKQGLTAVALIESISPTPISKRAEVEWFTPLYEAERSLLEERLTEPCVVKEERSWIDVRWCHLEGDQLKRSLCRVHCRSSFSYGTAGVIEVLPDSADDNAADPPITGLPVNYRRRPGQIPGSLDVIFPMDDDGWRAVSSAEVRLIASDMNRRILPLIDSKATVRRKRLDWYGIDLFTVQVQGIKDTLTFHLLWKPGLACALDSTAPPIHAFNRHRSRIESWRLETEDQAAEYLAFFCDYVWGAEGPFHIVTNSDDPCLAYADPNACEPLLKGATLDGIKADIGSPKLKSRSAQSFEFSDAYVFYAEHLFRATFEVKEDGGIEMLDDQPLMKLGREKETQWIPPKPAPARENGKLASRMEPEAAVIHAGEFLVMLVERDQDEIVAQELEGLERLHLKEARQIEIENKIVCGRLSLDGQKIGKRVIFRNCRFRGAVNLSDISAGSAFGIEHCVVEGGLIMKGAKVGGALSIYQSTILAGAHTYRQLIMSEVTARSFSICESALEPDFIALQMRIEGDLIFNGQALSKVSVAYSSVGGRISILKPDQDGNPITTGEYARTAVGGDLSLEGVRADSVRVSAAEIRGPLNLGFAVVRQWITLHGFTAKELLIVGSATDSKLPAARRPGINLYGAIVENNYVWLSGIDVQGSVDANFLRVSNGMAIDPEGANLPNRIGGDLKIGSAHIPAFLRVKQTEIAGRVEARGLKVGAVRFAGHLRQTGRKMEPDLIRIGGTIDFSDAMIEGEAYFVGIETGVGDETGDVSLNLRRARLGGNLTLYASYRDVVRLELLKKQDVKTEENEVEEQQQTGEPPGLRSSFPLGVNLRKIVVNGDVICSHVDVSKGKIDLNHAEIAHDVFADRTRTRSFLMEGIRCEGTVDLKGLELEPGGAVIGPNATVRHQLLTSGARIPGQLDLSSSELGELEVSPVPSFSEQRAREPIEVVGIILNRSLIGKLTVDVQPPQGEQGAEAPKGEEQYPQPVDLRYADIKWWEFRRGDRSTSDDANDYIHFLKGERDELKQRHTWRAVEDSLNNRGMVEEADRIHMAMREWLLERRGESLKENPLLLGVCRLGNKLTRRLEQSRVRKYVWLALCRFGDMVTRSQTSILPLGILVFLWLIVSSWFFSIPDNIGPTTAALGVNNNAPMAEEVPPANQWSFLSGTWIAIRHHVPIVPFTALDAWQPRNDAPLTLWRIGNTQVHCPRWFTPEDYANSVALLHWIIWPVILVIVSRKWLRRAQA